MSLADEIRALPCPWHPNSDVTVLEKWEVWEMFQNAAAQLAAKWEAEHATWLASKDSLHAELDALGVPTCEGESCRIAARVMAMVAQHAAEVAKLRELQKEFHSNQKAWLDDIVGALKGWPKDSRHAYSPCTMADEVAAELTRLRNVVRDEREKAWNAWVAAYHPGAGPVALRSMKDNYDAETKRLQWSHEGRNPTQ